MALAYVGSYGHGIPLGDDYALVPYFTGDKPVTAEWLWEPFNGHRIPVPKLLMLGLLRLSGGDFRVGMWFDVSALAVLAAVMIWVSKKLRGRTSYGDAFFPLILFHLGQGFVLLNFFGVHFASSFALMVILLLAVVRIDRPPRLRQAVLVAAGVVLLALCGIQGLIFVPTLALWLGYAGMRHWGLGMQDKVRALVILSLASALTLLPLFLVDQGGLSEPPTGLRPWLRTSLQFLATGFGLKARAWWPFSALAITGLLLVSGVVLAVSWWRQSGGQRVRVSGLLAFLAAVVLLTLGIGWGRAGWGYAAGFATHYTLLASLGLLVVFFTWELYGPRTIAPWTRLGLFTFSSLCFVVNIMPGLQQGRFVEQIKVNFERDLRAGPPCFVLAGRHARFLLRWNQTEFADCLLQLHRAGIGPFRYMQENPPFAEAPLDVEPTVSGRESEDGGSYLQFNLPKPRDVAGIRISFANQGGTGVFLTLEAFWKGPDQGGFPGYPEWPQGTTYAWVPGTEQSEAVTIWVGETISSFRLRCDAELYNSLNPKIVLLGSGCQGAHLGFLQPPVGVVYRAGYGAMVPRADTAARRRPEEPSGTVDPTLTAPGP